MTIWNELIKNALLGTEKLPLQEAILPDSIRNILDKTDKQDPEGLLLKAASLTWTYTQAGQSPMQFVLPDIAPSPDETQDFLSNDAISVLKKLITAEHFNPYLFELFLDKCIENQWVLPENTLVSVLNISNKSLQSKIRKVLGKRGEWLTQFNETWQWSAPQNNDFLIWQEGKPTERKEAFARLRKQQPNEALELLVTSWEQESAKDRKDFVNLLAINLSNADEGFLNTASEALTQSKSSQKPVTIEILQAINLLRLKIHKSSFGMQVFEQISSYIRQKKGLLGFGTSLKLDLPQNEDTFWNGSMLNLSFGFDKLSSIKGVSDAEYWFSEFVRQLHPHYWIDYFGGDFKKVLSFFSSADGMTKKDKSLFLYPFSEAMHLAETPLVEIFFEVMNQQIKEVKWNHLIKRIPRENQEFIIKKHLVLDIQSLKNYLLEDTIYEWRDDFSRYVVKQLAQEMQTNSYYGLSDKDFIHRLSRKLFPKMEDILLDAGKIITQEWQRNYWENTFVAYLLIQLQLKEEINKI